MLTKLEAVNVILDALDEDPVSSLASGLPEAVKATRFLDKTTKRVLAIGWHCNVDRNYTLTPDINGYIGIPGDTTRVDTDGNDKGRNVTVRDAGGALYLYDLDNATFVFTKAIKVTLIRLFDFDKIGMPALREYIAYLAAEEYQQSEMSSVALDGFLKERRMTAYGLLMDEELDRSDANMIYDNPDNYRALRQYRKSFYGSF